MTTTTSKGVRASSKAPRTTSKKVRAAAINGLVTPAGHELELETFRHFPYGILVFDSKRRLDAHNLEAGKLIEAKGLSAQGLTCCELLGCGAPETVLADTCVSELALAQGAPIPEIRVDIEVGDSTKAFWIGAAPLNQEDDSGRVVVQLRPGVALDRRRRTDPHWMSGPKLHIRAFGRMTVESAEGPISGNWLDQRAGQLLKYLVAERHRWSHTDEIGESIWPEADFAVANSVRYYVHTLRRKIEPQRGRRAPSSFIVSKASTYRIDRDRVSIDADEFEAHISTGLATAQTDPDSAIGELEEGLTLYRGDFLSDMPYADWAIVERNRLHDMACMALRTLADLRLKERMLVAAIRQLERLAAMQPYDEKVHRELMELDIAVGRHSDAMRRYNSLRARLRRTFGNELNFTPADLTRNPRPSPRS